MPSLLDLPPLKLVHTDRHALPLEAIALPPPDVPFILDDASAFLNLPPIGVPVDTLHTPRIAEATNPGMSNPRAQNMARRLSVDQTMSVTTVGGPLINSDGQLQLVDRGGAGQRGITVTTGHVPLQNSDGNVQLPNVRPQDGGTWFDQRPGGLPMEAKPDSQNPTKLTRVWADPLPVAANVKADDTRPGRLPTNHVIR